MQPPQRSDRGQCSRIRAVQAAIGLTCFALGSALQAAEPRVEERTFVADCDASKQQYVVIYPAEFDPATPRDMLLALHGHGSDRWQFVRDPRSECRAAREAAAKREMLYVSPDYRAPTSWMGPKAEADVVQIINNLRKTFRIERVFICGGSMGGTGALTFAARQPDLVSGVIAMNGTANLLEYQKFSEAIAESFGGKKAEIPSEYKARSAEYWPERLTMPIALTTGGRDTVVPAASVRRLGNVLEQLQRPVLLIHRAEGGHETSFEDAMAGFEFVFSKAPAFEANDVP